MTSFLDRLHPGTVVVSGGAVGVDSLAEQYWLARGERVISFRPLQQQHSWVIAELWLGPVPSCQIHSTPTWADRKSALFARDALIAQCAERVVYFTAPTYTGLATTGTQVTLDFAHAYRRPVYAP